MSSDPSENIVTNSGNFLRVSSFSTYAAIPHACFQHRLAVARGMCRSLNSSKSPPPRLSRPKTW
eukprot:3576339-Rhodomonas_salina.2